MPRDVPSQNLVLLYNKVTNMIKSNFTLVSLMQSAGVSFKLYDSNTAYVDYNTPIGHIFDEELSRDHPVLDVRNFIRKLVRPEYKSEVVYYNYRGLDKVAVYIYKVPPKTIIPPPRRPRPVTPERRRDSPRKSRKLSEESSAGSSKADKPSTKVDKPSKLSKADKPSKAAKPSKKSPIVLDSAPAAEVKPALVDYSDLNDHPVGASRDETINQFVAEFFRRMDAIVYDV